MTGKELIIYILLNNLEEEPVFKDGSFIGFFTVGQTAEKMNVGTATIYAWVAQNKLPSVVFGDQIYIPANAKPPVKITL